MAILLTGAASSIAQVSSGENPTAEKNAVYKALADMVRAKNQNKPFVLLTPADLSKLSAEHWRAMFEGDPCTFAAPITFGQTINEQLTTTDCRLDDFSYADFYFFNGTQGQQVTINLGSTVFDTYLGLANESGTFVVEDDDGGGGTNSRIIATLPATGLYLILANSVLPNQFGSYTLTLTGSTVCTYSLEPTFAGVPAAGGNFTFTVNTQAGCYWSAYTDPYGFISTSSAGNGPGTVSYSVTPNNTGANRSGTIRVGGQTFTVNQPFLVCSYSITPTSATVPATESIRTFTINAPAGCFWSARANDWFLSTNSEGRGDGTITYLATTNNGSDRTGTITVAGQTFTVHQPGLNCTFSVSTTAVTVNRGDHYGSINVITQPGCFWSTSGGYTWVSLENRAGRGSGAITYRIFANASFGTRTHVVGFYGIGSTNITFTQTGIPYRTRFDFDGDSKADLGFFRPSSGQWTLQNSRNNSVSVTHFGLPEDLTAAADIDGDRLTDICVFRPSTAVWHWLRSSDNSFAALQFGLSGDIPVPADYDGDGKADIAVYRPSTGIWWIAQSSTGSVVAFRFGIEEDKPVYGDFDGDRKADIALFRPSTGVWYVVRSSDNSYFAVNWGLGTDIPAAADYDGDEKADITVYRPSTGVWYILRSSNLQPQFEYFGINEDIPVPADYDADGRADISVYRPSTGMWWSMRTLYNTASSTPFSVNDGIPIPSFSGQSVRNASF